MGLASYGNVLYHIVYDIVRHGPQSSWMAAVDDSSRLKCAVAVESSRVAVDEFSNQQKPSHLEWNADQVSRLLHAAVCLRCQAFKDTDQLRLTPDAIAQHMSMTVGGRWKTLAKDRVVKGNE